MTAYSVDFFTREQASQRAADLGGAHKPHELPVDIYLYLPKPVCDRLYARGMVKQFNRELRQRLVALNDRQGPAGGLTEIILQLQNLAVPHMQPVPLPR